VTEYELTGSVTYHAVTPVGTPDRRASLRVGQKFHAETTVTASFPSNPIAYEAIGRYLGTM
jgi:hypothetical protein